MEKENVFLLILTTFDMHTFTDYILGDICPSFTLFSLRTGRWEILDVTASFLIWVASCFSYCVLLDPQKSRRECYHPPLMGPHADLLQMPSICLSHQHSRRGGCIPKCPQWAGLLPSAGSCMQKENMWCGVVWCGGLQSPELVPKGLCTKWVV